jgi:hypothetical protein
MNVSEIPSIKISCGTEWAITQSKLCSLDPEHADEIVEGLPPGITIWDLYFVQDLFQAIRIDQSQLLDVGWYPDGARDGHFKLLLVEKCRETDGFNWDSPVRSLQTRSVNEIVRAIKSILS